MSPVPAPCRITQRFGANPARYQQYGIIAHDGLDLTGPQAGVSVPIYAPCDGRAAFTEHISGYTAYGLGIQIMSPPDPAGRVREVILGHNASRHIGPGQYIHQGDLLAMMGATGSATGIHCHLGLRFRLPDGSIENYENGYHGFVNAEPYLRFWLDHPGIDPFITYT